MMENTDVMILHFGLHYLNESLMRAEYESMMPALDAFAAQPGKAVLLLEVGVQHFPGSPHGGYEERSEVAGWTCCAPIGLGASETEKLDRNRAWGLLRPSTRPTLNLPLLLLLLLRLLCASASAFALKVHGKSCGHVQSRSECLFSMTLLLGHWRLVRQV